MMKFAFFSAPPDLRPHPPAAGAAGGEGRRFNYQQDKDNEQYES